MKEAKSSARYDRKSVATAPDGRVVLVSTVGLPLVRESMIFPVNAAGEVAGLVHLYKARHGAEDDLDSEHDAIVAGVRAGTITLLDPDREPTPEEIEEARGEMLLLAKMAMDDETPNA